MSATAKELGALERRQFHISYFCLQCDLRFLDFYFFPGSMPGLNLLQLKMCEKCAAVNAGVVYSKYSQLRSKQSNGCYSSRETRLLLFFLKKLQQLVAATFKVLWSGLDPALPSEEPNN